MGIFGTVKNAIGGARKSLGLPAITLGNVAKTAAVVGVGAVTGGVGGGLLAAGLTAAKSLNNGGGAPAPSASVSPVDSLIGAPSSAIGAQPAQTKIGNLPVGIGGTITIGNQTPGGSGAGLSPTALMIAGLFGVWLLTRKGG